MTTNSWALPFLALALVGPAPVRAAAPEQAAGTQSDVREFQITTERFKFTPDTIEVMQGDLVGLVIVSKDVTRGFGIPKFEIEQTITRDGPPVTVEFAATEAGRFPFECSEYCGNGHNGMMGTLVVTPCTTEGGAAPGTPAAAPADEQEDELRLDPAQPDFTLVTLPTTLRLPRNKLAFRVTHRFARPLGQGDFSDLLADFFGFDSGALIGLELRFGLFPGTQVGIYRTSNRVIQLFGQQSLLRQGASRPVGLDAIVLVQGRNNLRHDHSPGVGVVVSRKIGEHASFYVEPFWIGNTNIPGRLHSQPGDSLTDKDDTFTVGLGTRVRIRPTVYVVAEVSPRVAGFDPGDHLVTLAFEKRVGGHSFQVNFSNSLGSTLAQVAQGASRDNWYIGFNITRKFF